MGLYLKNVALRLLTVAIGSMVCWVLCGCASQPEYMSLPPPDGVPRETGSQVDRGFVEPGIQTDQETATGGYDLTQIKSRLNVTRSEDDLGFYEKSFDSCKLAVKGEDGDCGPRFFTSITFRLRCRDSEETVSHVSTNFEPLVSEKVKWKLAEQSGVTKTNSDGFGQVEVISHLSQKGKRLVLIVGKQFLGSETSQVGQLVVPNYWCSQIASDF